MNWWKHHAPWSFCDTDKEIHSFWMGFLEVFPIPWPARYHATNDSEYKPPSELHYYLLGHKVGLLLDAPLFYGLYKLFVS